jgi:hypothetical protein
MSNNISTPFVCPVCAGKCILSSGFYNNTSDDYLAANFISEPCRSCDGTGIVWSIESVSNNNERYKGLADQKFDAFTSFWMTFNHCINSSIIHKKIDYNIYYGKGSIRTEKNTIEFDRPVDLLLIHTTKIFDLYLVESKRAGFKTYPIDFVKNQIRLHCSFIGKTTWSARISNARNNAGKMDHQSKKGDVFELNKLPADTELILTNK